MVSLGYQDIPTQDRKRNRMVVYVQRGSHIVFKGQARIGGGVELLLKNQSELFLGKNFYVSFNSTIYCFTHIEFGDDCTIGWNVCIMDTDWHFLVDVKSGMTCPYLEPVRIGSHCWICNDVQIQKGTEIPNNIIVAARSLCNKKYDVPEYSLIAGVPAVLKKNNINYVR